MMEERTVVGGWQGVHEYWDCEGEYLRSKKDMNKWERKLNQRDASSAMVFSMLGLKHTDRVMEAFRLIVDQIKKRYVTTGLMVEASLKDQETVGVLSLPVIGECHAGTWYTRGEIYFCKTRAASSRSDLVIQPFGLSQVTKSFWISTGHWTLHTKFLSSLLGSIHTPQASMHDVSVNPRLVGCCWNFSAK